MSKCSKPLKKHNGKENKGSLRIKNFNSFLNSIKKQSHCIVLCRNNIEINSSSQCYNKIKENYNNLLPKLNPPLNKLTSMKGTISRKSKVEHPEF